MPLQSAAPAVLEMAIEHKENDTNIGVFLKPLRLEKAMLPSISQQSSLHTVNLRANPNTTLGKRYARLFSTPAQRNVPFGWPLRAGSSGQRVRAPNDGACLALGRARRSPLHSASWSFTLRAVWNRFFLRFAPG